MAFKYKDYTESDEVKKAAAELSAKQAATPTYESGFEKKLSDIMGRIENREKFSYDMNADPLYQQLKDSARRNGNLAMRDAMGQASALTGGYGNSYAASVGQQSQNAELQKLNDMVPSLYQLAREQYDRKGQDLLDLYSLYSDREAQDYARHRDRVSDHYSELGYLQNKYDAERSFDYGKHTDAQSYAYNADLDYSASIAKINADLAKAELEAAGDGEKTMLWNYSKTQDDNGNYVYYGENGKKQAIPIGVNPYNGEINPDILDSKGNVDKTKLFSKGEGDETVYSNTYQPNNVKGQPLKKTGQKVMYNGREQNLWQTPDGKLWRWDGTKNKYDEIELVD